MIKRLPAAAFAILVSVLSLAALETARRPPRQLRIGDIRPCLNFSIVCIEGLLLSQPYLFEDGEALLMIADETGALPVFLKTAPAGPWPEPGTRLLLTGRLQVGADHRASLRVQNAAQVRAVPPPVPAAIRGRVVEYQPAPAGSRAPHRMVLQCPSTRLEAVYWFALSERPRIGQTVEVRGRLDLYRGRLQVRIDDPGDVRCYESGR
jgi:hypothetical protein